MTKISRLRPSPGLNVQRTGTMNWYYAHDGTLDPETVECIFGQKIQQVARRLQEAIQVVSQGTFQPDREKDELTYALQNPEHPGVHGAREWLRGNMASEITSIHIEAGIEGRTRSAYTCEGYRNSSSHKMKEWQKRLNARWP